MKKYVKHAVAAALIFSAFICLDKIIPAPLGLSLYIASLYAGGQPIILAAVYLGASFLSGNGTIILSSAVQATLLGCVFLLYGRKKRKPSVEMVLYVFASSIVYLIFDERAPILQKLVYMAVISLFSATLSIALQAVREKGTTVKPLKGELLCAILSLTALGAGAEKLLGAGIYRGASVAAIMLAVVLFDDETPALIGAALASAFVINDAQPKFFLPYLVFFLIYYAFAEKSRLVSALLVITAEAGFAFYFGFYGEYGYAEAVYFCAPQLLAALLPKKLFAPEEYGYLSVEQALNKSALNSLRGYAARTLSEAADSFLQMKAAISYLNVNSPSDKKITQKIAAEVASACKKCPSYERCSRVGVPDRAMLERIAEIGFAKKRVTIIDIPKALVDVCANPNSVIFEVNKLIDGFSDMKEREEKTEDLKRVLHLVASGMTAALTKLSDDFSAPVRSDVKAERALIKEFKRSGVRVKGLALKGSGVQSEANIVYDEKVFDESRAISALSSVLGLDFEKTHSAKVSASATAATFTVARPMSVAYGVSSATKYCSKKSGDVYSVERISPDKVFIALSDGMGSGEDAGNVSEATISLIEAFYKAGFDSKTVLPLVNKILSFAKEDDFSAVDICVVDVFDGSCDFLKIGAPYGFILSKEGVRYLEGSSLPLGILDTLSPTVAKTNVVKGDMLLFLTDGVTDAFGSSSEMIEYLKTTPLINPQSVSDSIIKKALSLCGGTAQDDMTVFCARVI